MSAPAGLVSLLRESIGKPLTVELAAMLCSAADTSRDRSIDPARFEPRRAHGCVFQVERMRDALDEIRPFHMEHFRETEAYKGVDFAINYAAYLAGERAGSFVLFTCRDEAGALLGYLMIDIYRCRHTSLMQATEDALYLRPGERKGYRASALIGYALKCLGAIGVRHAIFTSKVGRDIGALFRRAGGVLVAGVYLINLPGGES
jgi:hypothetical protein